jgi:Regulator of chromosome condensation (RCC1) repeat
MHKRDRRASKTFASGNFRLMGKLLIRIAMFSVFRSVLGKLLRIIFVSAIFTLPLLGVAEPVADLTKIALGDSQACGITRAGALRCSGSNFHGELGVPEFTLNSSDRAIVSFKSGVTDVAVGSRHICAVVRGIVYCWGHNEYGQIGNGRKSEREFIRTPTKVSGLPGSAVAVYLDNSTSCAIIEKSNALYCWGNGRHGKLGEKPWGPVLRPKPVFNEGVSTATLMGSALCAVVSGGLECKGVVDREGWRTGIWSRTVVPAGQGVTGVVPGTGRGLCAVVRGSLKCWERYFDDKDQGATTVFSSGVTAVAGTFKNVCAVASGRLQCWGDVENGLLGANPKRTVQSKDAVELQLAHGEPATSIQSFGMSSYKLCVLLADAKTAGGTQLQCNHRSPERDDYDSEQKSLDMNVWGPLGTEGVSLAPDTPPKPRIVPYGVWTGTVGNQDVSVLLSPGYAPSHCDASYYYHKHLVGITISEVDRRLGAAWQEYEGGEARAQWKFSTSTPNARTLVGEWTSTDGQRRAPIRLKLLESMPSEVDKHDGKRRYLCHTAAKPFDVARLASASRGRIVQDSAAIFKGSDATYPYRAVTLLDGRIESLEFPDTTRNPALHKMLRAWEGDTVSEFYQCLNGLQQRRDLKLTDVDFHVGVTPIFWNAHFLTLHETYSNYCGGAHPNGGTLRYIGWDIAADRAVNFDTWVKRVAKDANAAKLRAWTLPSRLKNLIVAGYKKERRHEADKDCVDSVINGESFRAYPSTSGMVFEPVFPHVIRACEDPTTIPWRQMQPFLTPVGLSAVNLYGLL